MYRRHFVAGLGVALGTVACSPQSEREGDGLDPATGAPSGAEGLPLDAQALEDTLVGSSYMGCGGGGSLQAARDLIAGDLAAGLDFRQIKVAELADDDLVASPYSLASLAPLGGDMKARLDQIEKVEAPTVASFRLLEDYLGQSFTGVIVGEIGPLSMAEALSLAARIGVPSLDADTVGRATPEINQHSVRVAGHAITPAAAVTLFGDEIVLRSVQDPAREEELFRTLSKVSRELGVTDAAISGAVAKEEHTLVQGSLTLARSIGRAVREASDNEAKIEAARVAGDGYRLFDGRIVDFDWADKDGFLIGTVTLQGQGEFSGQSLLLDYKNEHLVARRDGVPVALCPDLITMVDRQTAEGIGNPEFDRGQDVVVLGFRAPSLWRRPQGLEVFSPRYFGYDFDYQPIENIYTAGRSDSA